MVLESNTSENDVFLFPSFWAIFSNVYSSTIIKLYKYNKHDGFKMHLIIDK